MNQNTNTTALPIYLDNQATTPVDPAVLDAMMPFFGPLFGNAHSVQHEHGRLAAQAVERARNQIAEMIGAEAREIVFTSGATESNNIAIKGMVRFHLKHHNRAHIITAVTEHKCVLECCKAMEAEGARVTWLPVRSDGLIDLGQVAAAIADDTVLVSIMAAHNEIGVLQPVAEIGALCREHGVQFHTDAAQAAGKILMDVQGMNIDMLSISGHKIYGPKGIGALYVRRKPRVRLEPMMSGGGQERGIRSGTLPVPLCVGLGEACAIAWRDIEEETARVGALRKMLFNGIDQLVPDAVLNGSIDHRLPGNLNFSFPGVDGDMLLPALQDIAVSSGSACTSAEVEPSYVLRALGRDEALARASLRFGIGRFTTEAEIEFAVDYLATTLRQLRQVTGTAGQPASFAP